MAGVVKPEGDVGPVAASSGKGHEPVLDARCVSGQVVVGAAPSFSPLNGSFLGYLATLTEREATECREVKNMIAQAITHALTTSTMATEPVDKIADNLLLARFTAELVDEERLLASLASLFK